MTAAVLATEALDPEKLAEYADVSIETAQTLATEAENFGAWVLHNAGLTEKEGYEGWLPLLELAFVAWRLKIQPALTFAKAFGTEALALMQALRKWAGEARHAVDVVTQDIVGPFAAEAQAYENFVNWLTHL